MDRPPPVPLLQCLPPRQRSPLAGGRAATGNYLVHAENEFALGLLTPELRGAVRCIYIDPPYNNQEIYTHYVDRASHRDWLERLTRQLRLLLPLLTSDGSIWISIDDREMHYLKVAADEVFGRENFVHTFVWQHRTTRENRKAFSNNHEYILVYAREMLAFRRARSKLPPSDAVAARYKNPDNDPRGPWQSVSANVQAGHATPSQFYALVAPSGRVHRPPNGRCWVFTQQRMKLEIDRGNVWFGKNGDGAPRLKRFLCDSDGITPETLWMAADVGTTNAAKKHLLALLPDVPVFDTPKPEALITRVCAIATRPGDLVLDAFLGSGTTAAVAHKMGRRYIGIESDRGAAEMAAARLRAVVDGEVGGISGALNWRGGGGFDFVTATELLRLAASNGSASSVHERPAGLSRRRAGGRR